MYPKVFKKGLGDIHVQRANVLDYLEKPQNMNADVLQEKKSMMKWYPRVMNSLTPLHIKGCKLTNFQ